MYLLLDSTTKPPGSLNQANSSSTSLTSWPPNLWNARVSDFTKILVQAHSFPVHYVLNHYTTWLPLAADPLVICCTSFTNESMGTPLGTHNEKKTWKQLLTFGHTKGAHWALHCNNSPGVHIIGHTEKQSLSSPYTLPPNQGKLHQDNPSTMKQAQIQRNLKNGIVFFTTIKLHSSHNQTL